MKKTLSTGTEALYWHQIMGIFSISTTGHVVVADSCGVQTFAIHEAREVIDLLPNCPEVPPKTERVLKGWNFGPFCSNSGRVHGIYV